MKTVDLLENFKFEILNHCLEINEYKKENKYIPIESYEQLMETYLMLLDSYIDSQKWDEKFKSSIGDVLGIKYE